MINRSLRSFLVRFLYGLILFVIALATLESLSDLCLDVFELQKKKFHCIAAVISLVVASIEAFSMKGLEMLKGWLATREDLPDLSPKGNPVYRFAYPEEIPKIHELAKKSYGMDYVFPEQRLRDWQESNRYCFFVMLHDEIVVGYIDAFPISYDNYEHLLHGKDETKIVPQAPNAADERSSFYIASIVIKPGYRGIIFRFVIKALQNYDQVYATKPWRRICAVASTPSGERLVKDKGMKKEKDSKTMWFISSETLPSLTQKNQIFWKKLLTK